jgi:hypothetical protein
MSRNDDKIKEVLGEVGSGKRTTRSHDHGSDRTSLAVLRSLNYTSLLIFQSDY